MKTVLKKFQLATAVENTPSGKPGPNDVFYSSTLFNRVIPANASNFILCANADGTGDTYVDDLLVITVNGTQVFKHDYSNGNSGRITPLPPYDLTSVMRQFAGETITIESTFTDLYPNNQGGSAIFLCIS
jgi:hypothetical protein